MSSFLFVTEYLGFVGGIERYAQRVADILRAQGDHVDLAYCKRLDDADEMAEHYDRVLALEEALTHDYTTVIIHKWRDLPSLTRIINRFAPRVIFMVHDHDVVCPRSFHYLPNRKRTRCPYPYHWFRCSLCAFVRHPRHWHGRTPWTQLWESAVTYERRIEMLQRNVTMATNSHFMITELERLGFSNVHLLAPFTPLPTETEQTAMAKEVQSGEIVFVGQLIRGKGCDLLLDALTHMAVPYHLTIVGDGNDHPWLITLVAQHQLNVTFTGRVTDPSIYLRRAQVVAFPSRWDEPFGMAIIEAGAWRKPVVAFDVGGVSDIIQDHVTGRLIPANDTQSFAQALCTCLTTPHVANTLGVALYDRIKKHFSETAFLASLKELL